MMKFDTRQVALLRVDFDDLTYQISTKRQTVNLAKSIQHIGLINEPYLVEHEHRLQVVSGFRRLGACRDLNWKFIPVKILSASTKPLVLARLAISEKTGQRSLDLVEQARALGLLAGLFGKNQQALRNELIQLNLDSWWGMRKKLLAINEMSIELKNALSSDIIGLPVALELSGWGQATARRMIAVFTELPMGLNRQRDVVTLIREISLREKCSKMAICDELQTRCLSSGKKEDRGTQARKMQSRLFARRYPSRAKAQRDFDLKVKKIKLGPGMRLIPPSNFEAHQYRLEMGFKSHEELRGRIENLKNRVDSRDLIDLLPRK